MKYITPADKIDLLNFTARIYMKTLPELYTVTQTNPDMFEQVLNREYDTYEKECKNSLELYRKRTHEMIRKYNKRKENNFYMPEYQKIIVDWAKK